MIEAALEPVAANRGPWPARGLICKALGRESMSFELHPRNNYKKGASLSASACDPKDASPSP